MTLIEKIFFLQSRPPFNTLLHSELVLTANIAKVKKYAKGAALISKDIPVQSVFLLYKGEASYEGKKVSDFFGAEELINDVTLQQNVIAESEVEALIIGKGHFFTLIYECPGLMLELLSFFQRNRIQA